MKKKRGQTPGKWYNQDTIEDLEEMLCKRNKCPLKIGINIEIY